MNFHVNILIKIRSGCEPIFHHNINVQLNKPKRDNNLVTIFTQLYMFSIYETSKPQVILYVRG